MKRFVILMCLLVAALVCLTPIAARAQADVVETFKVYLDAGNTDGMLSLYGEKNQKEPLKLKHYEKMRPVMYRYIDAWQGVSFVREAIAEILDGAEVVYVKSSSTDDLLKFYLRNYMGSWFVSDIEVYALTDI